MEKLPSQLLHKILKKTGLKKVLSLASLSYNFASYASYVCKLGENETKVFKLMQKRDDLIYDRNYNAIIPIDKEVKNLVAIINASAEKDHFNCMIEYLIRNSLDFHLEKLFPSHDELIQGITEGKIEYNFRLGYNARIYFEPVSDIEFLKNNSIFGLVNNDRDSHLSIWNMLFIDNFMHIDYWDHVISNIYGDDHVRVGLEDFYVFNCLEHQELFLSKLMQNDYEFIKNYDWDYCKLCPLENFMKYSAKEYFSAIDVHRLQCGINARVLRDLESIDISAVYAL